MTWDDASGVEDRRLPHPGSVSSERGDRGQLELVFPGWMGRGERGADLGEGGHRRTHPKVGAWKHPFTEMAEDTLYFPPAGRGGACLVQLVRRIPACVWMLSPVDGPGPGGQHVGDGMGPSAGCAVCGLFLLVRDEKPRA